MIRRIAAALGLALLAAPALACPEATDELIFHSCWGEARAELLLLPEDRPLPEPDEGGHLIVTGTYTGREPREGGQPAPVGFYMRRGEVVNRNMSRMDGLMVVRPEGGTLNLHNRAAVPLGGRTYNLRRLDERHAFTDEASQQGLSVMQSHLLVIDGEPDVTDQPNAPRFRRRVLFTDEDGFGVFQTTGAVTLYDAVQRLEETLAPEMALNLDMGSYDFCVFARDGVERQCGILGRGQMEKLSNLVLLAID